ncbi:MAG: metal-sensitive transcriptional regulator [Ilumatobacter sp.]|nr:MAG: metal-sensitive transcriptional regulator [Ilumatobacter sp.]
MGVADVTPGYHDDKAAILTRLRRVEGQVRGLQRMVEDDTYCIDVLTQVAAATSALQSVAVKLVDEHLRHCVAGAAEADDPAEMATKLAEASRAIERLVKS